MQVFLPRQLWQVLGLWLVLAIVSCNSGASSVGADDRTDRRMSAGREVYDAPAGTFLGYLSAADKPVFTGRVGDRLFRLYTPRDTFFEPYLEVLLPDGRAAWIYARPDIWAPVLAVNPLRWQAENRIQALLGSDQLKNYRSYREVWAQAQAGKPAPLLVQAFRTARSLRHDLEQALAAVSDQPLSSQDWETLLPGFLCQLDDGNRPRWWVNYRQWLALARQLEDTEATALFSIYCQVYPQDSIEYFYPAWRIAESRQLQHSLLGRGIHTRLLRELAPMQAFRTVAGIEASELYEQVLEDILLTEQTYWEAPERIVAELDSLLLLDDLPLSTSLRNRLEDHRRSFAAGKPLTNIRAGQLSE
jgi:hypothetical protein